MTNGKERLLLEMSPEKKGCMRNIGHCGHEDGIAAEKEELVCDGDNESASSSDSELIGKKRDLKVEAA